jgi:hypothetical protein
MHDEIEWGTEVGNIYMGENHSYPIDSDYLTYAKIDTFSPFIQLPTEFFNNYV